jgi:membrane protease subunit (stomatin/prohibitin family)
MVGGTAYAVGKHAQRGDYREEDQEARLQQLEAQQYSQQAAPPPTGGPTDIAANLAQLKSLLDQGALTQAEYDAAKQKLLTG